MLHESFFPFTDLGTLADCIEEGKCRLVTSTMNVARFDEAKNADPERFPALYKIGQLLKAGKLPHIAPFDCSHFPSILFQNRSDGDPLRL